MELREWLGFRGLGLGNNRRDYNRDNGKDNGNYCNGLCRDYRVYIWIIGLM